MYAAPPPADVIVAKTEFDPKVGLFPLGTGTGGLTGVPLPPHPTVML